MATATATPPAKKSNWAAKFAEIEAKKAENEARAARIEQELNLKSQPLYHGRETTPAKIFGEAKKNAIEQLNACNPYKTLGHFVYDVTKAAIPSRGLSQELDLWNKAAQGMNEGSGADAGYLVPPEFSSTIFSRVYENDIVTRTDRYTCSGNTMKFPAVDETSRANGSRFGGVMSYWIDEGGSITKSKPSFRLIQLILKKLATFAYVTDELLSDAIVSMDQYLTKLFAMEIAFRIGDAIINGDGVGKPLGVMKSGALVSVSAEPAQATKTILAENIVKMFARLWAPSQKNAVWLVNQDVFPSLALMSIGVGLGGLPVYLPPGGLSGSPFSTLMGLPVIVTEFQPTLGTTGDILLCDLSQIISLSKGSVDTQTSMHLAFQTDELAYRCIFRFDAQPWWNSALTPFQGSNTQSPFVALATR